MAEDNHKRRNPIGYISPCVTPEYKAWDSIKYRCLNPKHPSFEHYGGRGITICAEWVKDFKAFLAHVGQRPTPKHSIDRYPNHNGNYTPGNVRWATKSEQTINRRKLRGKSIYRGVFWDRRLQKWYVQITDLNTKKRKHVGVFIEEFDAATAYNFAVAIEYGKEAVFNI